LDIAKEVAKTAGIAFPYPPEYTDGYLIGTSWKWTTMDRINAQSAGVCIN